MQKKRFLIFKIFIACALLSQSAQAKEVIDLQVGFLYDERITKIDKSDLGEILKEANRVLQCKLKAPIVLKVSSSEEKPLQSLFSGNYLKSTHYKKSMDFKVNPAFTHKQFTEKINQHKKITLKFLKKWPLSSYRSYFPKTKIDRYEDAWKVLMATYYKKIQVLKELKTNKGDSLLLKSHPPWQSYLDWHWALFEQNQYDIVITNSLIVCDDLRSPFLHSVSKHAKIGGSGNDSPKRKALDMKSIMINVLEFYGDIKGISTSDTSLTKTFKNKALGGFYLAHEFGHVFYFIPDQYEHGAHCLMNSAYEDMDYVEGYKKLSKSNAVCRKCLPWIRHRHAVLKQQKVKVTDKNRTDYIEKTIELISECPKALATSREVYLSNVLNDAMIEAYKLYNSGNPVYFPYCFKIAIEEKLEMFIEGHLKHLNMSRDQLNEMIKEAFE